MSKIVYKICSKCNNKKILSEFPKANGYKGSIFCWCRSCKNDYKNKHYKHKERIIKPKIITDRTDYLRNYRLKTKARRNQWLKQRRANDINFRLLGNLRHRINISLKNNHKSLSTMFLIGCELDYLMYYIQCQFIEGMSWDNYGEWHIDHIKPCASFNLSDSKEQLECFHYSNLQPLWALDNISKSDKVQ